LTWLEEQPGDRWFRPLGSSNRIENWNSITYIGEEQMRFAKLAAVFFAPIVLGSSTVWAQEATTAAVDLGQVVYPASSMLQAVPSTIAVAAKVKNQLAYTIHTSIALRTAQTNVTQLIPKVMVQPPTPQAAAAQGYFTETPASLACMYGLTTKSNGCNPNSVFAVASGGRNAIGIVDAYDAPNIKNDLVQFSTYFSLPPGNLEVHYAGANGDCNGQQPERNSGWELETSLDVEWAHAIAPGAKIILVEAHTNSLSDLIDAEQCATKLVTAAGGGQISNSWGLGEAPGDSSFDKYFTNNKVVYFAASGDAQSVEFPSTSTNVVAVGGTTVLRDAASGSYIRETAWIDEGAGSSSFNLRPTYQNAISKIVGKNRGVVDIVATADAHTGGVWVYVTGYPQATNNWVPVGGTSAASPIVAGVVNLADSFRDSSQDELKQMYSSLGKTFGQVTTGKCGPNGTHSAGMGWSFCAGVGTPNGKGGL
jgi:kumamolisin